MTHKFDMKDGKEKHGLVKDIRIAICGDLPTACRALRDMGVSVIHKYDDALNAASKLRRGERYHLILVYAPQGEGLDAEMPYKIQFDGEWQSVPIKLLNEPACESALVDLESTVHSIAREHFGVLQADSG